jgi:hypothetical protein
VVGVVVLTQVLDVPQLALLDLDGPLRLHVHGLDRPRVLAGPPLILSIGDELMHVQDAAHRTSS